MANLSTLKAKKSSLAILLGASASTSLKSPSEDSDYITTDYFVSLSTPLNDRFSLQGYLAAEKEFTDGNNQKFTSSFIGLNAKVFNYNDYVTGNAKLRAYLPVDDDARRTTSYRGRAYGRFDLSTDMAMIGIKKLSILTSLRVGKNIHEFEYKSDGSNNISYYNQTLVSLAYAASDQVTLSLYGTQTNSWDYDNFRRGNSYSLGQVVSYSGIRNLTIDLTHEIGGKTFGPDGKESNIELLDKDKSTVALGASYSF